MIDLPGEVSRKAIKKTMSERIQDDLTEMVNQYVWKFYVTGTFGHDRETFSPYTVKRRFFVFLNELRKKSGSKSTDFFFGTEPHKTGLLHQHILLGSQLLIDDPGLIQALWHEKYGFCKAEKYDASKGAAHYLTKYVTKAMYDWDLYIVGQGKKKS
jgi:hypothetical protein